MNEETNKQTNKVTKAKLQDLSGETGRSNKKQNSLQWQGEQGTPQT